MNNALWVRADGGVQTARGPVCFSNYLVTVNANLPANAHNRGRAAITHCMRHVLAPQQVWDWLTARTNGGGYRLLAPNAGERQHVHAIRARIAVEANGAQNASPHLHCYLEITHALNVRIDFAAMNAAIRQGLRNHNLTAQEAAGANIDIRLIRGGSDEFLLHYLTKNRRRNVPLPQPVGPNQPTQSFVNAMNHNRGANQMEPMLVSSPALGNSVGIGPRDRVPDEIAGGVHRQYIN